MTRSGDRPKRTSETEANTSAEVADDGQSVWLKFEDIVLTKGDQKVLLHGGLLQDQHTY